MDFTTFALLALIPRTARALRDLDARLPGRLGQTLAGVSHLVLAASVVQWDGWWAAFVGAEALAYVTVAAFRR
jgi:hypothetical protein